MAYVPPHKRDSKHSHVPSIFSPSRPHHQQRKYNKYQGAKKCDYTAYAEGCITRWNLVYSKEPDPDAQLLPSIRLKEVPTESVLHKDGKELMVLVSDDPPKRDVHDITNSLHKTPWVSIVESIQEYLLVSLKNARKEMCKNDSEPNLVFRFGKVLFHGSPNTLDNIYKTSVFETTLSKLTRTFNTNISNSFVEAVLGDIVHKVGADLEEETEFYVVKVFDKSRPGTTITCKCNLIKDVGELDIFQIELNQMRHLVFDMSCLEKNLDLRLMVASKRLCTSLSDDEKHSLRDLLNSAVIDPEVKGGLRWPPRKESADDQFVVIGAWHAKSKVYKNSFIRIKVRHADRYDFRFSTGDASNEVTLRMTELSSQLMDKSFEMDHFTDLIRDTLKLIWENLLCWEGSLV